MKDTVQRNPGGSLAATLCAGLALGLLLGFAWTESRRKTSAQHLLEDIEDGFRGYARTSAGRASSGLKSIRKGMRGGEAQLEDVYRNLRGRLASLFS